MLTSIKKPQAGAGVPPPGAGGKSSGCWRALGFELVDARAQPFDLVGGVAKIISHLGIWATLV